MKKSDLLEAEMLENLEENLLKNLMEETPPPDDIMEGGEADFGFVHMIMA